MIPQKGNRFFFVTNGANGFFILILMSMMMIDVVSGCTNMLDPASTDHPYSGAKFTAYGTTGLYGACGTDVGAQKFSAAVSADFFDMTCDGAKENDQSSPTKPTKLNTDPVCTKGYCVWICYKGKTVDVLINNKCPECARDHVDLSMAAAQQLDPNIMTEGMAKGATLVYHKCDKKVSQPCPPGGGGQ